jgi:hypothetical protein
LHWHFEHLPLLTKLFLCYRTTLHNREGPCGHNGLSPSAQKPLKTFCRISEQAIPLKGMWRISEHAYLSLVRQDGLIILSDCPFLQAITELTTRTQGFAIYLVLGLRGAKRKDRSSSQHLPNLGIYRSHNCVMHVVGKYAMQPGDYVIVLLRGCCCVVYSFVPRLTALCVSVFPDIDSKAGSG